MRKIPDDEAKQLKHDVPDPPTDGSRKKFEEQLAHEKQHGHPAFKAVVPEEED